jgi:hypothetical protein
MANDELYDRLVAVLRGPRLTEFLIELGESLTISARGGYEVQSNSVAWLAAHNEIQHRLFPFLRGALTGGHRWTAEEFAHAVLARGGYGTPEAHHGVRHAVDNTLRCWGPEE